MIGWENTNGNFNRVLKNQFGDIMENTYNSSKNLKIPEINLRKTWGIPKGKIIYKFHSKDIKENLNKWKGIPIF